MDQGLRQAAEKGDIEAFYQVVREEPDILKNIDEKQFVETPLHVAASLGHTEFAMEMMRLNPSFARKPNPDGLSPIHLALQINKEQLVRELVRAEPDLVRVKGRGGETPLHCLAAMGNNLHLLAKFLLACPDSIKDVTIRNETALHIALNHNMVEAFQVLLGFLERGPYDTNSGLDKTILNMKNNEGNTVLHIATSKNLPKVVEALLKYKVAVNKKNLMGKTALDIVKGSLNNQEIMDMLRRVGALEASAHDNKKSSSATLVDHLKSKVSFDESLVITLFRGMLYMSSHSSNILLGVAVLIATTTYQAGLSPPGGVWQDNTMPSDLNVSSSSIIPPPHQHNVGRTVLSQIDLLCFSFLNHTTNTTTTTTETPILPHNVGASVLDPSDFFNFYLLNSIAFSLSTSIIILLLPNGICGGFLRMAVLVLYCCYLMSMYKISNYQPKVIILGSIWMSLSLVIVGLLLFKVLRPFMGCGRNSRRLAHLFLDRWADRALVH